MLNEELTKLYNELTQEEKDFITDGLVIGFDTGRIVRFNTCVGITGEERSKLFDGFIKKGILTKTGKKVGNKHDIFQIDHGLYNAVIDEKLGLFLIEESES